MTDIRTTQIGAEQWAGGTPAVQTTQVLVEHWAAVGTTTPQVAVTMMVLEQWATPLPVVSGGTTAQALAFIMA